MRKIDLFRPFVGTGLETPEPGGERACLGGQFPRAAGVVDGRDDLAAVADDAGILQKPLDVGLREFGDLVDLEIGEGGAKIFALPEDGQPGEA